MTYEHCMSILGRSQSNSREQFFVKLSFWFLTCRGMSYVAALAVVYIRSAALMLVSAPILPSGIIWTSHTNTFKDPQHISSQPLKNTKVPRRRSTHPERSKSHWWLCSENPAWPACRRGSQNHTLPEWRAPVRRSSSLSPPSRCHEETWASIERRSFSAVHPLAIHFHESIFQNLEMILSI